MCFQLENNTVTPDLDLCDINSYLAVLSDFLMALKEPVIRRELLPTQRIESSKLQVWCKSLLEAMDVASYNIFMYVHWPLPYVWYRFVPSVRPSPSSRFG